MKKFLLLVIFLFVSLFHAHAQEEEEGDEVEQEEGWTTEGQLQILFSQSAFNKEWTGGGTSSMSGNLIFNYDFSYRRDKWSWDNKLLVNYGLTRVEDDDFARKTSDRFEINSVLGRQIGESHWHFSFFTNFRTQLDKGYTFSQDPETNESIRTEYTNFLSPGYLQFGPGILVKKSENLYANLAPATARFIFVDPAFTGSATYSDGDYFGIDAGESTRFEFGASLTGYAKFELFPNVVVENSLGLYSNYLDKPGNIDIDYLLNLELGVNNYITANFLLQAIYDDNAVGAFQIREVFGAGVTFSF